MQPSDTLTTTAIAAQVGWSVVQMALRLDPGMIGYEELLFQAQPMDVRIWLTPIIGWVVEVVPSAVAPHGNDRPSATVSAVTVDGVSGDEEEVVRGPDGQFRSSKGQSWETEMELRIWYLAKLRKAAADPNFGTL